MTLYSTILCLLLEFLDFWLKSVHTHLTRHATEETKTIHPPVIIVCTKKDLLDSVIVPFMIEQLLLNGVPIQSLMDYHICASKLVFNIIEH